MSLKTRAGESDTPPVDIASFKLDAPRPKTYRLFYVADGDRGRVLSPYTTTPSETDTTLNNLLSLHTESGAVLRTATGHWLFVRPDVVDLYVEMAKIAGRPGAALPVYGYVLEGVRPLLVLRVPPEQPVPAHELGYFRRGG